VPLYGTIYLSLTAKTLPARNGTAAQTQVKTEKARALIPPFHL